MYSIIGGDGREYGPVEKSALIQWAREGRVVATTTIIDQATGQRFAASQMPELNAVFNPGLAAGAGAYVPPPGPQSSSPYGSPYGTPSGAYNPYSSRPMGPPPGFPNLNVYLGLSIASLVCCGGLLAVPAIVYSANARGKEARGDYMGAMEDVGKAKMWLIIAVILGALCNAGLIALQFAGNSHGSSFNGF